MGKAVAISAEEACSGKFCKNVSWTANSAVAVAEPFVILELVLATLLVEATDFFLPLPVATFFSLS